MRFKLPSGDIMLIDKKDLYLLKQHKFYLSNGYAVCEIGNRRNKTRKLLRLHRMILNAKQNELIDHINQNKLDNRRKNLRICNSSTNGMNRQAQKNSSLGIKNVTWCRQKNRYRVTVQKKHYGFYNELEQAISAAYTARLIEQGEFACV